jgi:hypothetical protein
MKVSSGWSSHGLAICTAAVLLSSCSSPGSISNSSSIPQPASQGTRHSLLRSLTSVAVVPPKTLHPDQRKSWVSHDAGGVPRWAFVSDDATDDVDMYSLPDFKLEGTITGFNEPQGMCSDQGNVWVANTGTEQVLELSRDGKVIATINDSYGYPVGCAHDPTTGDIAVTNIFDFSGAGAIYVYPCPSCMPKVLKIGDLYDFYFVAYDTKGDIFVDGKDASGAFILGEVPAGDTNGFIITVSGGTIYFPGLLQWDKTGNYVAVGDQLCGDTEAACVYWVQVSGSQGTITGKTTLSNPSGGQVCDLVQGEIDPVHDKNFVGGDYEYCGYTPTYAARWLYPAGGEPTNDATSGLAEPIGAAISTK